MRSHRARIRVPGLEADVTVEDIGEGPAELGESVDTAYRTKYGSSGSESMVTASAAATNLRLTPEVAEYRADGTVLAGRQVPRPAP